MEWMPILSKVIEAVLIALLPPLAAAGAAFLAAKAKELWARAKEITPNVTEYLEEAAKFAVLAAEQAGAAYLVGDKKQYAIEVAEAWLATQHLTIEVDLISAAIEKAVLEVFNMPPKEEG